MTGQAELILLSSCTGGHSFRARPVARVRAIHAPNTGRLIHFGATHRADVLVTLRGRSLGLGGLLLFNMAMLFRPNRGRDPVQFAVERFELELALLHSNHVQA